MNWKHLLIYMVITLAPSPFAQSMELVTTTSMMAENILTQLRKLEEAVSQLQNNAIQNHTEIAQLAKTFEELLNLARSMPGPEKEKTRRLIEERRAAFAQSFTPNVQQVVSYEEDTLLSKKRRIQNEILLKLVLIQSILLLPVGYFCYWLGTKNAASPIKIVESITVEIITRCGRYSSKKILHKAGELALKRTISSVIKH